MREERRTLADPGGRRGNTERCGAWRSVTECDGATRSNTEQNRHRRRFGAEPIPQEQGRMPDRARFLKGCRCID